MLLLECWVSFPPLYLGFLPLKFEDMNSEQIWVQQPMQTRPPYNNPFVLQLLHISAHKQMTDVAKISENEDLWGKCPWS